MIFSSRPIHLHGGPDVRSHAFLLDRLHCSRQPHARSCSCTKSRSFPGWSGGFDRDLPEQQLRNKTDKYREHYNPLIIDTIIFKTTDRHTVSSQAPWRVCADVTWLQNKVPSDRRLCWIVKDGNRVTLPALSGPVGLSYTAIPELYAEDARPYVEISAALPCADRKCTAERQARGRRSPPAAEPYAVTACDKLKLGPPKSWSEVHVDNGAIHLEQISSGLNLRGIPILAEQ